MYERNWGLILAAGFGIAVFSALGGFMLASQTYSQYEQRIGGDPASARHRQQPQQSSVDRAGLPRLIERAISNPQPEHGKDNEKRDLAAQEATATFTFWIVILAALQTVVAAVGIYYIRRTIRQGQDSLQHARTVSFEQLRAYIGVQIADDELEKLHGFWRFRTTLRNYGQTPATEITASYMAFYSPFPVPIGVPEFPEGKLPVKGNPLMPGQARNYWTQGLRISPEEELAISTFRGCILTRMEIAYTVLGGKRIDCPPILGIHHAGSGGGTAKFDERHLIGGGYPNFNAADDEPDPEDQANQPPLL